MKLWHSRKKWMGLEIAVLSERSRLRLICFSSIQNLDCVCECKVHTYLHIYVIWCKSRMGIYEKGESSLIGSGWENKGSQWCLYLMKAVGKLIWAWISKMEREGWGRVIGGQIKAKSNNTCMWYIYIWHIWHIHVYDDITVALMFLPTWWPKY